MSSEIDQKLCSKHQIEILIIDLKQSTVDEDKYLCIKCLMDKIDNQNIELVKDTKTMIKQMKSEQLNCKIKENQRKIDNYREIQSKVSELKLYINNSLGYVVFNIDQTIIQLENELEQSEYKIQVNSFKEDVGELSKNYKGSQNFEIPKEFQKSIEDNSYIDSIQQELYEIVIKINQTLEQFKVDMKNQEMQQFSLHSKKEGNQQNRKSLNLYKQGNEITLFNLNAEKTKFKKKYNKLTHKLTKLSRLASLSDQVMQSEKTILENQKMIIDIKTHDAELIKMISDLKNEKEGLSVKLKEQEQYKTQCEIKIKELQVQLHKSQKPTQKMKEAANELQQSTELQFSTIYKHSSCQVSQNGKIIENTSGGYYCCMCDQMIPKKGVFQFAFKIIEISEIMIGVGIRDVVQKKGYKSCYSFGGGTYNIYYTGQCLNNDETVFDSEKIAFPFSTNDIIIVEVDRNKKQVIWKKQSTKESFSLSLDTSKDLYPCVHFYDQCKVEIVNKVFKKNAK